MKSKLGQLFNLNNAMTIWFCIMLVMVINIGFAQTNLITNGGFEDKTTGWMAWQATVTNTTDAHSGSSAALVSNRKNPWDAIAQDLTKVLVNGETYTLSAWVKIPKSAVNFRATLHIKAGGVDTYNGLLWTNSPVIGYYSFYTQTFTQSWTGVLQTADLYFETESVAGVYSDYILDDVQLVKSKPLIDLIQTGPGWKDIKSTMLIGGCVGEGNKKYWNNAAGKAQVLKDCNTVTVQCYPGWGRWDETKHHVYHVDEFTSQVQEMKKQHMNVTAHMLLGWDQYFPVWFKENDFPADTLEAIMDSWLKGIIKYKGNDTLVDVWNVVNEAISWNGTGKYWPENNTDHLNACEMQRMGYEPDMSGLTGTKRPNLQHPVYIRKAFEYARTLTKKKLELRDSGFEFPTDSKYNAFYELAVHLKKMNAPVDVIGFQTHLDLERVYDWEGYTNNIRRYVQLGYAVNIPEVDIGDVAKTWSDYKADLQKAQYYRLVTSAIKGGASELQTWGFIDDGWRPGQHAFPYSNYFEPKPAYYGIKEALIDMSSILYWEMDATVDGKMPDVMKYNNFGTLNNFSTPVLVSGYQSKALQFDGVDDYISTGKLSDSISKDLTFSCYIKTTTTKPSIIADIAGGETSGLKIGITSEGKIYLNGSEAGLSADLVGLTAVNDDAWHFIALQRDSVTYRLYVDGNAAVVSSGGDIHPYTRLVLGAKSDGTNAFKGTIDEVKLYDTVIEEGSFTRSMAPWAPIRLSISKNKMNIRLDWIDQSSNEKGFIVERKTADTDWQEIARVSTNISTYTDIVSLYNTEYTYRVSSYALVKSAPSNSISITSPLDPNTGLLDREGNGLNSIYPNPVQDKFTLISSGNIDMKLFDLQGKLMLEKRNCAPSESFDLNNYSKGIYFVQTCDNKKTNVMKLIKY